MRPSLNMTNSLPAATTLVKSDAPQDRHRGEPYEEHGDLHDDSGNDERLIAVDSGESGADDSFYRHVHEGWAGIRLLRDAATRDGAKFRIDGAGTKRAHDDPVFAHFAADAVGEARD